MCGRYTQRGVDAGLIADQFDVKGADIAPEVLGRFNVCPTETVLAVCADAGGDRVARSVRWGLVPRWARALGKGHEPINARSETAAAKAPFAELVAAAEHRCLLVADGWYEWLRAEQPKRKRVPFHYTVDGGVTFAFAGVWHERRLHGQPIASAALLTTASNPVCAPVHDRMPCVLADPDAQAAWLSPELDAEAALAAIGALAATRTGAAPAHPAVNKAGVEGDHLLVAPAPEADAEPAQLSFGVGSSGS